MTPLPLNTENVPPFGSGYAVDGDRSEWKGFADKYWEVLGPLFEETKEWVLANGGPEIQWRQPHFMNHSPHANIYMYPLELDYTPFRPNPPNWHRFDAFFATGGTKSRDKDQFEIPVEFQNKPGKLIYFSMGTIGSGDLVLMKRLVGFLANSPNKFIVSKGTK
jgi:UDP:flavonoid glycosyltransferase YjiC (YdhE family)